MTAQNEELVAQLQEALAGFSALDRNLVLGEVSVELVGRLDDGRLVLVRSVSSVDATAIVELMDLLGAARSQAALLARHVGASGEGMPPLIVLVAEEVDELAARRLATLDAEAIRILEVHKIVSERAQSTFLVPRTEMVAVASSSQTMEARLAGLDRTMRRRVELLVERLERVDEELILVTTTDGLEWRWRGRLVVSLALEGSTAYAAVVGHEEQDLDSDELLESLVDRSIDRWLSVTEETEDLSEVDVRPPAPRSLAEAEELDTLHD